MANATKATKYIEEATRYLNTVPALAGVTHAILHLADMQRERNQLAAMTAKRRGMELPDNLHYLLEGTEWE